uniref:RNA helicase n=1 Tax=Schistocephalus solidus TaxID=70667 RepID=A0A0X3PN94_SCHSO
MVLPPKRLKFLKPGEENLAYTEEVDEIPDAVDLTALPTGYDFDRHRENLPTFRWRTQFLYLLETCRVVVVTGETGSGKSTQLPQYVYEAGWLADRHPDGPYIAVTQPRRVAALTLAARVAEEKNWRLGQEVGYLIRFEDCFKPGKTSIIYMTDGMLIQEMTRDPLLRRYRIIMLDEVHERSIQVDLLMGLVKKVLRKRPNDLRVIVSSATLEAQTFIDYFKDLNIKEEEDEHDKMNSSLNPVAHLHVEGRQYPVNIYYLQNPTPCYVHESKETVFKLHEDRPLGADILVFLTSQDEVTTLVHDIIDEYRSRKEQFLRTHPSKPGANSPRYPPLRVLPLYGGLPQHEQLRVFDRPSRSCRKVVVATNVAEASVTLPGITYVVDCGYVRLRSYNANIGLEALVVVPVSKASANQRAGRAGRVRMGEVYRLYTEEAYDNLLPRFTAPESQRSDLSAALLRLKSLGVDKLASFDWLPPKPPIRNLGQAAERLVILGALELDTGRLSVPRGSQLAGLCAACGISDPSAAAALLGAVEEGCTIELASIVALMQLQNVFVSSAAYKKTADRSRRRLFGCLQGDHITELNALTAFERESDKRTASGGGEESLKRWCKEVGLNGRGLARALYIRDKIAKIFKRQKLPWVAAEPAGNAEPIIRALLRGYFTQVALLSPCRTHYLTVRGDHALRLHPNCVLYAANARWPAWILFTRVYLSAALDPNASDLRGTTGAAMPASQTATCVSGVSAIKSDWLLELAPHYYQFGTDREHVRFMIQSVQRRT